MKTQQTVEFAMRGKVSGVEIAPKTIGLSLFNQFNNEAEDFIKGSQKGLKLSNTTLEITEGSYRLGVVLTAAVLASLEPDILRMKHEDSLGEIDPGRAEVVKRWQARAKAEADLAYEVTTAGDTPAHFAITKATDYRVGQATPWVKVEKYLFGRIVDMGGASSANVHLALEGQSKLLVVDSTEDFLRDQTKNRLYHKALLRIKAEQNTLTGVLRDPELIEFADYEPRYDEEALERFIEAGTQAWADVPDAVAWVRQLRGGS